MATSNAATGEPRSLAATRPLSGAVKFMPKAVAFAGLAVLAACTSTQGEVETGDAMLPRPQVVIVERFAHRQRMLFGRVQMDEYAFALATIILPVSRAQHMSRTFRLMDEAE